ncbi:hypothetical protein TCAL_13764 [Tigriopus californicus]|uniref:Glycosyl transferase 64 domain-containing protein n=1 Tax=Tigriopus californicus TaxID=6832 RepID=A0A553N870_TIGCA|nr:exostosin-3-like [Tigriopus californicus]TRY61613.1 hypothetical protein TCAL_13764 [Tigriopus californicus]|eukprot:TCALIF_13764-PA protein Name:"Similar to Extl3 Exostosin-like 3 (Mus musculus)" AED:0.01 eAED:0.01 QI:33/1/0.85/1/1/1/7/137/613
MTKFNGIIRFVLSVLFLVLVLMFFWTNPRTHTNFHVNSYLTALGSNWTVGRCHHHDGKWKVESDITWISRVVYHSQDDTCFRIKNNQSNNAGLLMKEDNLLEITYSKLDNIRKVSGTTRIIRGQQKFQRFSDTSITLPMIIEEVRFVRDPQEELVPKFLPIRRQKAFIMAPATPEEYLHWEPKALSEFNFVLFPHYNVSNAILMQALFYGAIPVFTETFSLPLAEVLDWTKLSITLSPTNLKDAIARVSKVRTRTILEMRRQGFHIFRAYFSSIPNILDALCLIIMRRLDLIPPMFNRTESFDLIQHQRLTPSSISRSPFDPHEDYFLWNVAYHPWVRAPCYPGTHQRNIPKWYEETFVNDSQDFQTKYTPVFMTYKRTNLMHELLILLNGTRCIDQVIVIWNDVGNPVPGTFQLPDTYFPVRILRADQNSLNNRLLPFDIINTEAIFLMDDDTRVPDPLTLDHGFQIWKEHKDQMVGISPRTTAPDAKGVYSYKAGRAQDIALTLTSATFVHQYYAYSYTYQMPQKIRDEVDKHTNCEDIFMGGLISDFTAKAPVKFSKIIEVTCTKCDKGASISTTSGHYERRQKCINKLIHFYGYMPLVSTISFVDVLQP